MKLPIIGKLASLFVEWNQFRTTDVFFIGYPKTGNTWVRFLLGHYIQNLCDLAEMPLFDFYSKLGICEKACIGPAIHFTHHPLVWTDQTAQELTFSNTIQPFRKKKVVFIIRYPLDALVSAWFQAKYRTTPSYQGELQAYLHDAVYGLDKCLHFYDMWNQHNSYVYDFMLLEYEKLQANTVSEFSKLLQFLGLPLDSTLIEKTVVFGSFENMRKIEASGNQPKYKSSNLSVFATGDKQEPGAFHVRKGKIGGYKEYLSPELALAYEDQIRQNIGLNPP